MEWRLTPKQLLAQTRLADDRLESVGPDIIAPGMGGERYNVDLTINYATVMPMTGAIMPVQLEPVLDQDFEHLVERRLQARHAEPCGTFMSNSTAEPRDCWRFRVSICHWNLIQ